MTKEDYLERVSVSVEDLSHHSNAYDAIVNRRFCFNRGKKLHKLSEAIKNDKETITKYVRLYCK